MEELFRGFTPDGRILVEVLWCEAPGVVHGFLCRVVLDGKFTIEEFKTDDGEKVIIWARKHINDAMRRSGPPKAN